MTKLTRPQHRSNKKDLYSLIQTHNKIDLYNTDP